MRFGDIETIIEFTKNDFKLKYKNNYFGYLWSIINPLLMLLTLYAVFTYVFSLDVPHYQLFLLLGIISWNHFSEATTASINSLNLNSGLLKKHKINPILIILSTNLSTTMTLALNLVIFFIMAIISGMGFSAASVLFLVYVGLLFLLTLSVSFLVSGIYVIFRDVFHIWSFSLLIGFWLSPIVYSEMVLPENIRSIYMLNPMARIISHIRNALIYNYVDSFQQVWITFLIISIIFVASIWIFTLTTKDLGEMI